MAIAKKYQYNYKHTLRDIRSGTQKFSDAMLDITTQASVFSISALAIFFSMEVQYAADLILLICYLYFKWLRSKGTKLPAKLPMSANCKDPNNTGGGRSGKSEGILYLGNVKDTQEELWIGNSDARTHFLYLGTTGAGKTEGLKSLVANTLCWGSGFIYIDGKADTTLWSSLSALARRFGRDDDLLVLNYMTGNRDGGAPSNTLNPFSGGSSSYLTNLMVSLMPEAGGDNAMWKERAVALIGSLMPALTWKRDNQELPLNVGTIRDILNFPEVIKLSRDPDLPPRIRSSIKGYLDTLPGYVDAAFDDDGNEKPMPPDAPAVDTSVVRQQHGYLSMQFTRSLQSLADDYGYIFETESADIDMVDVVLNRRIVVVLIPALEKSGDEAANLGKIVAATIKGMMGSTLGADVEGDVSATIENKPTEGPTPFMSVFDEVGYYTSQGMAVMAAQARSLGFSLVFAAQDLPALEKRVKEEARSITANCNIKIFGKLEDPTQTKEFFEKTVGDATVAEVSGFSVLPGGIANNYSGKGDASIQFRKRASYDTLRGFKEGEAVVTLGSMLEEAKFFYANPGNAKSMRVQRLLEPPRPDEKRLRQKVAINKLLNSYRDPDWTAERAHPSLETEPQVQALIDGFKVGEKASYGDIEKGAVALAYVAEEFIETVPPPVFEAQKDAPALSAPTGEGISWNDLMAQQPTSKAPAMAVEDDNDDFDWGDIMGMSEPSVSAESAEEGDEDFNPFQEVKIKAEDLASPQPYASSGGGMSWQDFSTEQPQSPETDFDDLDLSDEEADIISGSTTPGLNDDKK